MLLPTVRKSEIGVLPIDWRGHQRYMNNGELDVLVSLFRMVMPKLVVEIGVNEGRTAKVILENVPSVQIYTGVDVQRGYVPVLPVQRNEVPERPGHMVIDDPRFQLVLRPKGSLDLKSCNLGASDATFIDGDHSRKAVIHDTLLARAITRPGGIIVWHDYHDQETVDVRLVLDEMYLKGDEILHVENTWFAYQRT